MTKFIIPNPEFPIFPIWEAYVFFEAVFFRLPAIPAGAKVVGVGVVLGGDCGGVGAVLALVDLDDDLPAVRVGEARVTLFGRLAAQLKWDTSARPILAKTSNQTSTMWTVLK